MAEKRFPPSRSAKLAHHDIPRDPSSDLAPQGHLLPQGEKGTAMRPLLDSRDASSVPSPPAGEGGPVERGRMRGFAPLAGRQPLRRNCVPPAPPMLNKGSSDHDHFRLSVSIGRLRTRTPVAAKIALVRAGSAGGRAGSPRPVGEKSLISQCTSTGGAAAMRIRG